MIRIARSIRVVLCSLAALAVLGGGFGTAAAAQSGYPRFSQGTLESMVAPIALYPDALLSQVLMAATYPQEVDEAARWSRDRPELTGDAAVRAPGPRGPAPRRCARPRASIGIRACAP
jgi:hypothetical protein